MNTATVSPLHRNLELSSRCVSGLVVVTGALALVGWILDLGPLKRVFTDLPAMVPNTALALALAGVSLWFAQGQDAPAIRRRAARACAFAVMVIGLLTLSEYLVGWNCGIDQWWFEAGPAPLPGRPAILTAINCSLLGLALLCLDVKVRSGPWLVEGLVVTAMLISLLALIGYACNVPSFYGWRSLYPNTGMGLHTAIAFTVLGAGVLCARPARGLTAVLSSQTHGGMVARRLLLAPVIIPLVTGLIRIAGQRRGLYNAEFGGWLFSFLNLLVFTVAIWWVATLLHRAEVVRRRAESDLHHLNLQLEQRVGERTRELSRAVGALQESEERVRRILESALDAVITIDEAGRITGWNREAEQMFGWTAPEIMGRRLSAAIIPPGHREAHERGLKHFLATGEGPVLNRRIEITALRREGGEFPIELAITPVRLGGGFIFSAFVRDITGRKRAEEEIRSLNANLERRVAERTAQLESLNKELEAFSYSVSHDLRAPLRHVGGYVEMLRHESGSTLSENGRRFLEVISQAARQMGALIDDLLDFSRMGRAELRRRHFGMDEAVNEVLQEMKSDTNGRNIQWEVGPLPAVFADRATMKQVWMNLFSNAVKYTRHKERAAIEVGCLTKETEFEFHVRDNGAGFDMQYADKLFGVFQRLHSESEFEGTGIGLANVRRIIVRHGGKTWAEGKTGEGATFHFTLPKTGKE